MSSIVRDVPTKAEMKKIIQDAGKSLVVTEFYTNECGNCGTIAPGVEALGRKFANVKFIKINALGTDVNYADYDVSGVPSFVLFKDGKKVDMFAGSNAGMLDDVIRKHL